MYYIYIYIYIPDDFIIWQPLEKPLWGHNFIVIMISETVKMH